MQCGVASVIAGVHVEAVECKQLYSHIIARSCGCRMREVRDAEMHRERERDRDRDSNRDRDRERDRER
jgi:hypothetical protein